MLVRVDPKARIAFIRPVLFEVCQAVWDVWAGGFDIVPVLTGGSPDPDTSYSDEPSHLGGWAYDFRVSNLPPDRVEVAYHMLASKLHDLRSEYRVILFYRGNRYLGTEVSADTANHPEHVHVMLAH